jgi:trans-aconitate 2-methyltransferase
MVEEVVSKGSWNPNQYDRFKAEREQPFYDLAALVRREPGMRVVDLGCGDGRLTAWLHRELGAAETLGIDSSEEMLAKSEAHAGGGVSFRRMDILDASEEYAGQFDLVYSNAALQWILGHETLIPRVARMVKPGGQFAIQMPANGHAPSHRLAAVIAAQEPFRTALDGWIRIDPVQAPEFYSALLRETVGCAEQLVRLQVYDHELAETRSAVEWVKGSLLTAYLARLPEDLHAEFLERYMEALVAEVGERSPYYYPFPRVFLWGRMPSA